MTSKSKNHKRQSKWLISLICRYIAVIKGQKNNRVVRYPRRKSDKTFYATFNKIKTLRNNAKKWRFSALPDFWSSNIKMLQKCYNGVGPESWSSSFRSFVTGVLDVAEESALIHDFGYSTAPRTYYNFTLLNIQFAVNMFLEGMAKKTYKIIPLGVILACICQLFGWFGFASTHVHKK